MSSTYDRDVTVLAPVAILLLTATAVAEALNRADADDEELETPAKGS